MIADRRQAGDSDEYVAKEATRRKMNPVPGAAHVLSLEVDVIDPSDFRGALCVHGVEIDGHPHPAYVESGRTQCHRRHPG